MGSVGCFGQIENIKRQSLIRSTVEKLPVLNVNIQTQKKIASILDSIVMSIDIARKKVDMDQNVKKYLFKNLFI